jgi:hypothetical protein
MISYQNKQIIAQRIHQAILVDIGRHQRKGDKSTPLRNPNTEVLGHLEPTCLDIFSKN